MSTSFIFRPHILETGNVATPDLLVDDVYWADGSVGGTTIRPLTVDRLIPNLTLQVTSPDTVADGAIVLMGGGAGMLVGLASNHRPVDGDPQLFAKPLSRQAWRYEHVADHWTDLTLSVTSVDGDVLQEGGAGDFANSAAILTSLAGGAKELASGVTVLCTGLPLPAQSADRYHLILADPKLNRTLSMAYDVRILSAP